jgi:hypothetical protein
LFGSIPNTESKLNFLPVSFPLKSNTFTSITCEWLHKSCCDQEHILYNNRFFSETTFKTLRFWTFFIVLHSTSHSFEYSRWIRWNSYRTWRSIGWPWVAWPTPQNRDTTPWKPLPLDTLVHLQILLLQYTQSILSPVCSHFQNEIQRLFRVPFFLKWPKSLLWNVSVLSSEKL